MPTEYTFQELSAEAQERAIAAIVANDNARFTYGLLLDEDEPVTPEHVRLYLEDEYGSRLRFTRDGIEV